MRRIECVIVECKGTKKHMHMLSTSVTALLACG